MTKYTRGLFIFHRDLRINDNIGLMNASNMCAELFTCFIFTPEQVGKTNQYRSKNAIQFMIESLVELQQTIDQKHGELMTFYGKQHLILRKLLIDLKIDCLFFNADYTPYSVERGNAAKQLCDKLSIACLSFHDYYLFEPGTINTLGTNGTAYKKYTPFYNAVINRDVRKPIKSNLNNMKKYTGSPLPDKISLKEAYESFASNNTDILVHGGRKNGLLRLKNAIREQTQYDETRDFFIKRTTLLSAYIKFGCVSIREVYHTFVAVFGRKHGLIRELIWREFFAHVIFAYPEVVGNSYQTKYRNLSWSSNKDHIEKWKRGETGFPIVDACMRELNKTGYMHNRGRMVVANFLIKTLLVDWRIGEKYFSQQLTDCDIASNNGNWQGISGTGVDMKPYYRDMNPWIQSMKFDREAEYIKKWVPELASVDPKSIHHWDIDCNNPKYTGIKYPKPIVGYDDQKQKMLAMYKKSDS